MSPRAIERRVAVHPHLSTTTGDLAQSGAGTPAATVLDQRSLREGAATANHRDANASHHEENIMANDNRNKQSGSQDTERENRDLQSNQGQGGRQGMGNQGQSGGRQGMGGNQSSDEGQRGRQGKQGLEDENRESVGHRSGQEQADIENDTGRGNQGGQGSSSSRR
jgi:hypothetical protein